MNGYAGASDDALVAGCLSGRKDAWDAFVTRFSKLIFWAARKTLASTACARRQDVCEEVFQDVFRKLLEPEGLSRLREVAGLRSYLTVLTCHAALDKVKALSRRENKTVRGAVDAEREGLPEDFLALMKDDAPGPAETAAAKERSKLIALALGKLSPKERACVEFHYLEGKTHREIGEILGLPQDTVSTVIRRARERLKAAFTEQGLEA